jgi:3-isopropylmalate/(R)-2-methylmalate dehydratase small subunit
MKRIDRIHGRALPLRGDNIDTDRIIPARFLRTVSFDGLERHVFEDDRAAAASNGDVHPFDDARFADAVVLVVNANFGCGSSREHAPQAIYRRGIRAVIGESFSEIFFGNSVMLGLPCFTASSDDVRMIQELAAAPSGASLTIDIERGTCETGDGLQIPIQLPASAREAFLSGAWDATASLLSDRAAIERVAANLPYLRSDFSQA